MDCEQEIKDLGGIVLNLAKSIQGYEKDLDILQMLVTNNMEASIAVMEGLKRTVLHQQDHITKLEQKIIHIKWTIEERQKK